MRSEVLHHELLMQLQNGWSGLPDKPSETPQTTMMALWQCSSDWEYQPEKEIPPEIEQHLRSLVRQRLDGVPLAYLTGRQTFMGIELLSSPEAMIPRKETEILGYAALELTRQLAAGSKPIRSMDVCTGSGNIALTLAHYVPECHVVGADLSSEAVLLAQRNAHLLGLAERTQFFQGDLFAPFENDEYLGQMDLITCNPPYISSAHVKELPAEIIRHEPHLAFDGGPFGVKIITRLINDAYRFLRKDGWLLFEIGLGQGQVMNTLVRRNPHYRNTQVVVDGSGEIRVIKTCRQ